MRNRIALHGLLLCAAFVVVVNLAVAQNPRVGSTSGVELTIPVGARDIALGGSTIASAVGVEALFWNPSGIAGLPGSTEAMFSSMSYIADIKISYAAIVGRAGDLGVIGLSVKSFDFGDIPLTTVDDPDAINGKNYSPSFITIGLSYGRQLLDNIAVGGTIKILSEKLPGASASTYALDFGLRYDRLLAVDGLKMGVTIKNIGPQLKYEGPGFLIQSQAVDANRGPQKFVVPTAGSELPAQYEIGLTYARKFSEKFSASVNGAFSNDGLYFDEYRTGAELLYTMDALKIAGRAGFVSVPGDENYIYGTTFGAGVSYDLGGTMLSVDYAYRTVEFFDANQVFTLKIGL